MPLGTLLPFAVFSPFLRARRFYSTSKTKFSNKENKFMVLKCKKIPTLCSWAREKFLCVLLRLCDVATICRSEIPPKFLHTFCVPFLLASLCTIKLNGWKRLTTSKKASSSDCSDACVFKYYSQFDRLSVIYFVLFRYALPFFSLGKCAVRLNWKIFVVILLLCVSPLWHNGMLLQLIKLLLYRRGWIWSFSCLIFRVDFIFRYFLRKNIWN
jgi:hypothetical protein